MKIATGATLAVLLAESMKYANWGIDFMPPAPVSFASGNKPTGAARAKREAKKRKNIRARNSK